MPKARISILMPVNLAISPSSLLLWLWTRMHYGLLVGVCLKPTMLIIRGSYSYLWIVMSWVPISPGALLTTMTRHPQYTTFFSKILQESFGIELLPSRSMSS